MSVMPGLGAVSPATVTCGVRSRRVRPSRSMTPPTVNTIWREPFMAVGQGTFVNDMLERCGLMNVFDEGDARYPEFSVQDLAEADPEIVLLSSEPYPFTEKHIAEINMILPSAPVQLVDGEFFSWYGSRLEHAPAYFERLFPV